METTHRIPTYDDAGKLLLRLLLSILILFHGVSKLIGGVGFIGGMLAKAGLPAGPGYLVYIGEVVAPLLILVGLYTRAAALIVIAAVLRLGDVGLRDAGLKAEQVDDIAPFDRKSRLEEQFYGAKVIGDERADLARINGSHAEDAVDAIGRAARDRQLVILNEAHHVPFDRVFAMRLARALRKEGFQYLACETFFIDDEHVLGNGYVAEKTGVYSREPMFVQFLMDAQKDGWKFVSYEPDVPGNLRESGMARNLVQRIFSIDAKAKVFVYAGYSHAKKVPASKKDNDESKLAAQLRRLTGIDPLTINQTTLYKHYDSEQQSRYYALAVKKLRSRQPAVLMDAQGKPIKLGIDDLAYDFEVVHPTYERDAVTGRYEWTNALPAQPRDIPRELLPAKGRRLVYAYRSASAADAAPYDVVLLKPGEPIPKFLLPAGDFVFEAED